MEGELRVNLIFMIIFTSKQKQAFCRQGPGWDSWARIQFRQIYFGVFSGAQLRLEIVDQVCVQLTIEQLNIILTLFAPAYLFIFFQFQFFNWRGGEVGGVGKT